MNKQALIYHLNRYKTDFREEANFIPRFLSLLNNFSSCYSRSLMTGHMTASAWIIDKDANSVLLVHHKKLQRWLQPGGHADGEENILSVAQKEAYEETGLQFEDPLIDGIFDVDIHLIPEHKSNKAHFHYDIRFVFQADSSEEVLVSDESHEVSWVPWHKVADYTNNNGSIHRMVLKTKLIFK